MLRRKILSLSNLSLFETEKLFQKEKSKLHCTRKIKFSIKDFSSKCDQIRSFLRICSHLLEKSLIENFIFCAVLLLWIYSRRPSGYLWFNGPRKSPVAGLN